MTPAISIRVAFVIPSSHAGSELLQRICIYITPLFVDRETLAAPSFLGPEDSFSSDDERENLGQHAKSIDRVVGDVFQERNTSDRGQVSLSPGASVAPREAISSPPLGDSFDMSPTPSTFSLGPSPSRKMGIQLFDVKALEDDCWSSPDPIIGPANEPLRRKVGEVPPTPLSHTQPPQPQPQQQREEEDLSVLLTTMSLGRPKTVVASSPMSESAPTPALPGRLDRRDSFDIVSTPWALHRALGAAGWGTYSASYNLPSISLGVQEEEEEASGPPGGTPSTVNRPGVHCVRGHGGAVPDRGRVHTQGAERYLPACLPANHSHNFLHLSLPRCS